MMDQFEFIVLIADDDVDDLFLLHRAAKKTGLPIRVSIVENTEELMDYLLRKNRYEKSISAPRPDLILLDLNMPLKGGLGALTEIKREESLQSIPIVIWSTSDDYYIAQKTIGLGACHYVVKPRTFEEILDALKKALEKCLWKRA